MLKIDWRYHLLKRTGYVAHSKDTSGKTLEFIGTSSIGKTGLFNKTLARLKNRWLFTHHLEFFNRSAPTSEIDVVLAGILKRRIEKINRSEFFCPWHSLLDLKLSVKVMYETMLTAQRVFPKGLAFDEGLFRHFAAEILEMGDAFPDRLWHNRAFIYLRARDPETALSHVKTRHAAAVTSESQRSRTDEQIMRGIVHDQETFQAIADRAPAFGCPTIVLDAESPLRELVDRVFEFESGLSRMFEAQENAETRSDVLATNR